MIVEPADRKIWRGGTLDSYSFQKAVLTSGYVLQGHVHIHMEYKA